MKRILRQIGWALSLFVNLAHHLLAQQSYTPFAFSTRAGLASGAGYADGVGTSAQFSGPTGVAVDALGNVYVADTGNSVIRKVTPAGMVTTIAGLADNPGYTDGQGSAARFNGPNGIAIDLAGNLYISDTGNSTIRKISLNGVVSTLAGAPGIVGNTDGSTATFNFPAGIAVDINGNLYVADTGNGTIRKITAAGLVMTLAGTPGIFGSADGTGAAAQFAYPFGVAIDSGGNVFVADYGNDTIRKISPSGIVTTFAGVAGIAGQTDGLGTAARFFGPNGVAVDASGDVYVADSSNSLIRFITQSGQVSTIASGGFGYKDGPVSSAQFEFPVAVALDGKDNAYVADLYNNAIREISSTGIVTTMAGIAINRGSADGTAASARFFHPAGGALDANGNLFLADVGNNTIREISADGVVTTFAGTAGNAGSADGTGSDASFNAPVDVALDTSGNLYVADSGNDTIRKITPTGIVSTLAGSSGSQGSVDGVARIARFYDPRGVAVDSSGNVFVADSGNNTVRMITQTGVVSTIAGMAGNAGSADGTGAMAQFNTPSALALDATGNLYVADLDNDTIRKIAPGGLVTTLAGTAPPPGAVIESGGPGFVDGRGSSAQFDHPSGLAVDHVGNIYVADELNDAIRKITQSGLVTTLGGASLFNGAVPYFNAPQGVVVDGNGNLYVADTGNECIRFGTPAVLPSLTQNPVSQTIALGHSVVFNAAAMGIPSPTYQWEFNGTTILGATDPILMISDATLGNAGAYVCIVANGAGSTTSSVANLAIANTSDPGHLIDLSTFGFAGTGANTLTCGFVVSGNGYKQVLLRGIGPGLISFGVDGVDLDPKLTLFSGANAIDQNDNWSGTASLVAAFNAVGAFPLPLTSLDSALLVSLSGSNSSYTAQIDGGNVGSCLIEIYDADSLAPAVRLANLSTRGFVGTGSGVMIGGFVIGGSTSETVLIRAIGPTLATSFDIPGVLAQPVVTLFSGGTPISSNIGWGGDSTIASASGEAGAFSLPQDSLDSVLLITLPPGAYSAEVSGANNGSGVALVEIYEVP